MVRSQNGWKANDSSLIVPLRVRGVDFPGGCRKGAIEVIFTWLAQQFNSRVERLEDGKCWGYSPNETIDGTGFTSNHASGTALDFNAPDHWIGTDPRDSFSSEQISEINDILSESRVSGSDTIRWGGNYSGRPDPMHFEFIGSNRDANKLADKLTNWSGKAMFEHYNSMSVGEGQRLDGVTKLRLDREYADVEDTHDDDDPSIIDGPAMYITGAHGVIANGLPGEKVEIYCLEAFRKDGEWHTSLVNVAYDTVVLDEGGNAEFAVNSLPNFMSEGRRLWWYVRSTAGRLVNCQVTCVFN